MPLQVEELSDLYTICVQEHLACQKCSLETKRNSSMLTLPLPVLDSNSHKLRTLVSSVAALSLGRRFPSVAVGAFSLQHWCFLGLIYNLCKNLCWVSGALR